MERTQGYELNQNLPGRAREYIRVWAPLFLISALGLFLELAIIRWIAGEIRLFAYFKNLPLLAAFLGLALGYAKVDSKRDYQPAFAPIVGLFVVLVLAVGQISSPRFLTYPSGADEFLWGAGADSWLALVLFLGTVLAFFMLIMLIFVPLGQATGREMARHAPLPAYIVNIAASLAGVWIFSLLSYLQTPPVIWFALTFLGIGAYFVHRHGLKRSELAIFGAVLIGMLFFGQGVVWSPYQRLEVEDLYLVRQSDGEAVAIGYTLNVQQVFYQRAIDLSTNFLTNLQGDIPELESVAFSYNLPYGLNAQNANVLIVGAGMGNDVAAALRNGAAHIDAVEIDPAIIALGRELHPEAPYADPRVSVFEDDARSFFKKTTASYDVIAFGLLDSHTLLSGLSNVRLDSFVYTLESFAQVRGHLNEGGVASVTFANSAPWILERLGRMMIETFGAEDVYVHSEPVGVTFVAGSLSPEQLNEAQLTPWRPSAEFDDVPLSTDDWPYLYLRARRIPGAYWQALLVIGAACLALFTRSFPNALRPNWHFWLLGAAFLLVEFKSITELALLFGTTWLVNALAISGVLIMVLAANIVVLRRPRLNLGPIYVFLFASLAFTYFLPHDLLVGWPTLLRAVASMLLLSLPLFFAGLIFGESLRRSGSTAHPLASNLTGTVAGGVLEYGSILWGIKSLYIIAAAVYAAALLAWRAKR